MLSGGNGTGQGNETEDEDHEFFDAMEEGVSANSDDKTAFVMKVPVSIVVAFLKYKIVGIAMSCWMLTFRMVQ